LAATRTLGLCAARFLLAAAALATSALSGLATGRAAALAATRTLGLCAARFLLAAAALAASAWTGRLTTRCAGAG